MVSYCNPIGGMALSYGVAIRGDWGLGTGDWNGVRAMADVWQGTLALMVLKTLEGLGPLHGYGIARRIEQTSSNHLVCQLRHDLPGPAEARAGGLTSPEWGVSENNRKAKFYRLTRAGRKQLEKETRYWEKTTAILSRFLAPKEHSS